MASADMVRASGTTEETSYRKLSPEAKVEAMLREEKFFAR
jgi:hypothetical protein